MGQIPSPQGFYSEQQSTEYDMKGKVVLVQGASSALGRELALIFASRKCKLVLAD